KKIFSLVSFGISEKGDDIAIKVVEILNSADIIINFSQINDDKFFRKLGNLNILNQINNKITSYNLKDDKSFFLYPFIKKLFKKYNHICIITQGNPLFLNKPFLVLINKLKKDKVKLNILPAISSLDYVINVLSLLGFDLYDVLILTLPTSVSFVDMKMDIPILIMNFHIVKGLPKIEQKNIIDSIAKRKEIYCIKSIDLNDTKFRKYKIDKNTLSRIIRKIDDKTTLFIP
ncbi:MAG: hypothetical protein N2Z20_03925, partial [Elusimicrobiales bacterium]|nr:hypothetical protein [Elusimicrobiales bacterium]